MGLRGDGEVESCKLAGKKGISTKRTECTQFTEKKNKKSDHEAPAGWGDLGRMRISPQPLLKGNILPGLREQSGLKASWTRRMSSKSASVKRSGMSSDFSMPTPCSRVSAPPISTQ